MDSKYRKSKKKIANAKSTKAQRVAAAISSAKKRKERYKLNCSDLYHVTPSDLCKTSLKCSIAEEAGDVSQSSLNSSAFATPSDLRKNSFNCIIAEETGDVSLSSVDSSAFATPSHLHKTNLNCISAEETADVSLSSPNSSAFATPSDLHKTNLNCISAEETADVSLSSPNSSAFATPSDLRKTSLNCSIAEETGDVSLSSLDSSAFATPSDLHKTNLSPNSGSHSDHSYASCKEPVNNGSPSAFLKGRRILSVDSWLASLQLAMEHGKVCPTGKIMFSKEARFGLVSIVTASCHSCNWKVQLNTDQTGNLCLPINEAVVWGTYAGASTYASTKHLCTLLEIHTPTFRKYQKHEEVVMRKWRDALDLEIMENGKLEAKIARENGDVVTIDGIEYASTAVYVDGGWSTRSYGHSYKSKGGVAVIIGFYTKRLLFVGIRNKFCLVCSRSHRSGTTVPVHTCFQNYDSTRSAVSMEPDILLEGFNKSIEIHGIVYSRLIGDGDSSVFITLLQQVKYPGVKIQKLECINHAVKRFNTNLFNMGKNTRAYPLYQRKLLDSEISRFGKALRAAKNFNHESNSSNAENLSQDITNIPFHIFGQHNNCRDYFCTDERRVEKNRVNDIHDSAIWHDILAHVNRLAIIAARLLPNQTSNLAESFMSRAAKFNLGKRCVVTLRGGWHLRMIAAGLSFNSGPYFYANTFRIAHGRSPAASWKALCKRQNDAAFRAKSYPRAKRRRLDFSARPKAASRIGAETETADYGCNPADVDMDDTALNSKIDLLIASKQVDMGTRDQIEAATIGQGSNDRWKSERKFRLTASVAGLIFCLRDSTNNTNVLKRLTNGENLGHIGAIQHGQMYEGRARRALEKQMGYRVKECGLFVSLENGIFAASPDGLVGEHGIVEIKCPSSLVNFPPTDMPVIMKRSSYLKPKSKVDSTLQLCRSSNYYKQVVMQLHVTGRQWCDFAVYTFRINGKQQQDYPLFVERIHSSEETSKLWEQMKPKLIRFYIEDLAPELLDSRILRNMKCRQPGYRTAASDTLQLSRDRLKAIRQTQVAPKSTSSVVATAVKAKYKKHDQDKSDPLAVSSKPSNLI